MAKDTSNLDFELPPDFADCGSLNWPTLIRLHSALTAAANATTSSTLTVRLANVQRGGARFISILLDTHHRLKERNRRLRLREAGANVRSVLEVCRLMDLFGM